MSSGGYGEILLGKGGPPLDLLLPGAYAGFSSTCANHHRQLGRPHPTGTQGHGDSACQAPRSHRGSGTGGPSQGGLGLFQEVLGAHRGSTSPFRARNPGRPPVPYLRPSTTPRTCPLATWPQPEPYFATYPAQLPLSCQSPPHKGPSSLIFYLLPDIGCVPAGHQHPGTWGVPAGRAERTPHCAACIRAEEEAHMRVHCAMLGVVARKQIRMEGEGAAGAHMGWGQGAASLVLALCGAERHPGRPGALVSGRHDAGPHMPRF